MIKFFRKTRFDLMEQNKTGKYFKYAIGEILLVVIGILIALSINNWNENQQHKKAESQYYQNIKRQITEDKQEIIGNINYNNDYLSQYKFGIQIIEENDKSRLDTLGYIALNLMKYSDVYIQGNIYETMVNSGEIKLLKNPDIIEGLRKLEEIYMYINKMEDLHRDLLLNGEVINNLSNMLKFVSREVIQTDELYSIKFQNFIISFIGIMNEKDEVYNRALDEIQSITELIDKELNFQND
ncbi:MAG: DUF6090 family protein [Aureibaculum sp.]|nr:DUF6090 family protein [Aureibaculum sp.]